VLDNPHITLPPNTRHDLESGVVDPRLVATLEKLAEHHDIAISVIKTGHPEFVAGSHSVSNHYYGRALDIASVDGRAVNAGNPAAREVATEIAALDPAIRPSEVGTPWPIGAPGFFSDAEHQNHLHIGFDDPPPAGLKLPGTEPAVQSHAAGVADQLGAPGAVVTKGQKAVEMAKHFLGTPYRWGGASPQTGFDCSGLMQYVYGRLGIHMPRVAEDQFHFGMRVGRGQLQPGDLVFFQDPTGYIHHVGMYVGGGKFIHAPHTGDVIKISSLDEPYYRQQFAGGSRAAPHEAVAATAQAPASPDAAPEEAPVAHAVRDTAAFEALAKQEASWHRHTAQFLHAVEERPAWAREAAHHGPAFDLSDAPGNYPGDDAAKTEIARWMAAAAEKAGLPPELPVMAALVESNLHNVNYGDRDSLGYFQMRTGTWNSGDYQGFPDHPELQLKWFIDHALAVKRQWIARGRAADLADPSKHGEWVADVEQPAAEYRFRYQLRLGQARGLLRG
jgi:cell wall-associated NlpC family hydrolase